jgi:hypothetical protein
LTAGTKVLPGFGIHPWWAHLHGSSLGSSWNDLLEASTAEQLDLALNILQQQHAENQKQHAIDAKLLSAAFQQYQHYKHQPSQQQQPDQIFTSDSNPPTPSSIHPAIANSIHPIKQQPAEESLTESSPGAPDQQVQQQKDQEQQGTTDSLQLQASQHHTLLTPSEYLAVVPDTTWEAVLRAALHRYPHAFVGEIGIDKAAVIPGADGVIDEVPNLLNSQALWFCRGLTE